MALSYKIAELTFKALHVDLSPTYLQQCVQVYTPARSLRSVNSYTLVQNRSRTVAGDCTFVHAAATVWNALPVSVTSKDSLLLTTHTEQIVTSPTRQNNILDIFITNRPSLTSQCHTIPGLGDHHAISIHSLISTSTPNKTCTQHNSPMATCRHSSPQH